jgi:hypothetical protein
MAYRTYRIPYVLNSEKSIYKVSIVKDIGAARNRQYRIAEIKNARTHKEALERFARFVLPRDPRPVYGHTRIAKCVVIQGQVPCWEPE